MCFIEENIFHVSKKALNNKDKNINDDENVDILYVNES